MKCRVALLTNIPAPYRLSFFRALGLGSNLHVFFDSRTEPNRNWQVQTDLGFCHSYLWGFIVPLLRQRADGGPMDERYLQIRPGIIARLFNFRPDTVVSIEFGFRSLQAALYCALLNVPLILWSEGTPHSEGWQGRFRSLIRRILVRRARAYWTNGKESTQLLRSYGARPESIHDGMIGVDTTELVSGAALALTDRDRHRSNLGVGGVVFLFSGQLIPRKGVREFLAALTLLSGRSAEFSVLILGDGPERNAIEQWQQSHPNVRLTMLGFRQHSEVPAIYAASDVFVMPTLDDNWSLVALEAAVAGLPQVFSRYNGASADLLSRCALGTLVDPRNANEFAGALRAYVDSPPPRATASMTAAIVEYYSPESCAARALQSFIAAVPAN